MKIKKNKKNKKVHFHKFFKKKKFKPEKRNYKFFLKKLPGVSKYFKAAKLKYDRKLTVRITSNNIHCNLRDLSVKKNLIGGSAGKYRIYISRKRLKKNTLRVLRSFYRQVRHLLTQKGLIINIIGPIRLRKKIIIFSKKLRRFKIKKKKYKNFIFFRPFIIKMYDKKCFNGCRPAKKIRKKRKYFRIFR